MQNTNLINQKQAESLKEKLSSGIRLNSKQIELYTRELTRLNANNETLMVPVLYVTPRRTEVLGGNVEILPAIIKTGITSGITFVTVDKQQYLDTRNSSAEIVKAMMTMGMTNSVKKARIVRGAKSFGLLGQLNIPSDQKLDTHEILEIYNDPRYKSDFEKAIMYEARLTKSFYINMGKLRDQRVLVDLFYQISVNNFTDQQLEDRMIRYLNGDINDYLKQQARLLETADSGNELQRRLMNY